MQYIPKVNCQHQSSIDVSISQHNSQGSFEEAPFWAAFITYLGYLILNIFGWFRDSMRYFGLEEKKGAVDNNPAVSFSLSQLFFFFFRFLNLTVNSV